MVLNGLEFHYRQHPGHDFHIGPLGLHAEGLQVGDAFRPCPFLHPTDFLKNPEPLQAQLLQQLARQQAPDVQIAIPVHTPFQFRSISNDAAGIYKWLHESLPLSG